MHSAAYQIILITVYAFIAINDSLISNTLTQPAIAGMISEWSWGLEDRFDGRRYLAVDAFRDRRIWWCIRPRLFYRRSTGNGVCRDLRKRRGIRIGLAVPVSLLMLQLDVVARFVTYFYYTGSIEPSTTCKSNESHD